MIKISDFKSIHPLTEWLDIGELLYQWRFRISDGCLGQVADLTPNKGQMESVGYRGRKKNRANDYTWKAPGEWWCDFSVVVQHFWHIRQILHREAWIQDMGLQPGGPFDGCTIVMSTSFLAICSLSIRPLSWCESWVSFSLSLAPTGTSHVWTVSYTCQEETEA